MRLHSDFPQPHIMTSYSLLSLRRALVVGLILLATVSSSHAWWDKEWTGRQALTVDTGSEAGAITEPIGDSVVLLRLHQGNFPFGSVREDGSDLRFVTEDDKTILPHQIEKWDSLMMEAFVWVKVPAVAPGAQTRFWMYYGNAGELEPVKTEGLYDEATSVVYHFGEGAVPAVDSSGKEHKSENAPTPSEGSMIGRGIRLLGNNPLTIPAADSLNWTDSSTVSLSAWIKPGSLQPNATLFSRQDGSQSFRIGLDQGIPYAETRTPSGTTRTQASEPLALNVWKHLAVVADGSITTIYVDGKSYASMSASVPALTGPMIIGGDGTEALGFVGELDELQISTVARPVGFIQLGAINQGGTDQAAKLLTAGEPEGGEGGQGHNEAFEHIMLFGDIAKNMMFDGWVVVFVCIIMALVGWWVAIKKFVYLNRIQKGTELFEREWRTLATDLTAIDHTDAENVKSLGGKADSKTQKLMHTSPVYSIYHIGSEEIRHRLERSPGGFQGLSARSIQAIRASLDAGMARESHRMNGGLIFLTISIAGGPYVGLLGTVMGVMITFAVIAKSGEVEVNSIAPGIASALLATVAGLVVAIPALFIYSYLSSRIRDFISTMQIFIDEFVTKMAEFYPTPSDVPVPLQKVPLPSGSEAPAKEATK